MNRRHQRDYREDACDGDKHTKRAPEKPESPHETDECQTPHACRNPNATPLMICCQKRREDSRERGLISIRNVSRSLRRHSLIWVLKPLY